MKKKDTPVTGIIMIIGLVLIGLFVFVNRGSQQVTAEPGRMLSASHVLICHGKDAADNRTKDEAIELAQKVSDLARKDTAKFTELVEAHSECPSKAQAGSLGNFLPEAMVTSFSEAVQDLEIGEVSDPVETEFGFHVILRREPK